MNIKKQICTKYTLYRQNIKKKKLVEAVFQRYDCEP